MKRLLVLVLLLGLGVVPAFAQGPGAAAAAPDPLSRAIKGMWDGVKRNIAESADKMPDANFAFKPTPEVRSFGELLGHVANSNFNYCSRAKGEANPNQGNDFEKKTAKADLVKAIADSNAYCDSVYGSMNDMKAIEMIKVGQNEMPRVSPLVSNISHDNEHYGNIVTYMRLKGLVPPSTERAQQMKK
jgi:uncharacterized damage-inducible protein DinB